MQTSSDYTIEIHTNQQTSIMLLLNISTWFTSLLLALDGSWFLSIALLGAGVINLMFLLYTGPTVIKLLTTGHFFDPIVYRHHLRKSAKNAESTTKETIYHHQTLQKSSGKG